MAKQKTVAPEARQLRVALVWNGTVQWEEQLATPRNVGLGRGEIFALPHTIAEERVVLLQPATVGYRFFPSEHVSGAIFFNGVRTDVSRLLEPTQIGPDDYGVLQIGGVAVFFQSIRPMANNLRTGLELDAALIGCIALAAFLVLSVLVVLRLEGNARPRLADGALDLNADIVRDFMVAPPPPPERQTAVPESGDEQRTPGRESPNESSGRRHRDEEGRVGRENAQQENTQIAGPQNDAIAARVRTQGLLGALAGADGNPLAEALNLPTTSDIFGGMGNVQNITGRGSGGTGVRGGGAGGGGTGNGSAFASGGVGSGSGGNGMLGAGGGGGGAPGRPRGEVAVRVGAGRPAASGGLSADQIARVVRQNASAIRYCYETQVQRRPNLRGQISIGFAIAQSGSVSSARVASSSMGSPDVEGCIVRVFRRMRFPQSESGDSRGTFPFNFSAGG